MGRRAQSPKGKAKPLARRSSRNDDASVGDLETRLAEALQREAGAVKREAEAQEQQAATAEILRVISNSPTDIQPVFDTILQSAVRLLGGYSGTVTRLVGDRVEVAAVTSTDAADDAAFRTALQSHHYEGAATQAILARAPINVADTQTDARVPDSARARAQARGFRSVVFVPLLRREEAIGAIAVSRREPGGFTGDEIALLQSFADQAAIAIENVRLFNELESRNRELAEALEEQTATAEIVRVISSSPMDLQTVLNAVSESAARLCDASDAVILLAEGAKLITAAHYGEGFATARDRPVTRDSVAGRAVMDRAAIHVADVQAADDFPLGQRLARADSTRTALAMPLVLGEVAIGLILMRRREIRLFSSKQMALLKTFANQAVIAIENVRLFNETKEALERQTATSDILRVISQSPTDVQPVFDAIVQSAVTLCGAVLGAVYRREGDLVHLVGLDRRYPEAEEVRAAYPAPVTSALMSCRAIHENAIIHLPDTETASVLPPEGLRLAQLSRFRSVVAVPMRREGNPIGAILVGRPVVGSFAEEQISLLQTFADQAVIAIENVRLFTELQASNRELTTALDTQTATSDILRVISRSQTDVQPVFDAIVHSAVRLLGAYSGALTRVAGDQIEIAAFTSTDEAGNTALRADYPQSLHSERTHAQAIRARAPLNIADAYTDPRVSEASHTAARARGYRSLVVVPLLRHDEAIGAISVTRRDPGGFTGDEIALLQTFADQAVIAIENARLLNELQARTAELTQSVDQLVALGEVGQAVSSSLDVDTVLNTIVGRAVELAGADGGTLYEYDERAEAFELRVSSNVDDQVRRLQRTSHLRLGEGAVGVAGATREPVQIPDIAIDGAYDSRLRPALLRAGTRALLAVPLLREERILGGLVVSRRTPGAFAPEVVSVLKTFATQSALAIQNARLFQEIEDKSRQLEAASQHKSEFLANMSHELRTPLNAIIGFSEVLTERMFGELNEKQDEYLRDIYASGQHLLSLINDILDLSKIEAGRMELEPADFDLPGAIDNALTLVRERAGRRSITLVREIDDRVGVIRGDERKVKQVLLNLLSNALKFTPEGGRIDVRATTSDGTVEVSVLDTGVGIAPEDQEAVFEEFRQVGTADKKVEGTGLGLALSRKFIELHGGRIWVKSQVGTGSTFTFTIPVRREPGDREALTH